MRLESGGEVGCPASIILAQVQVTYSQEPKRAGAGLL